MSSCVLPDHLLPLAGGSWAVWRCAALRSAGFPVSWVSRIADARLAGSADRVLEAEDRFDFARQAALGELRQPCSNPGERSKLRKARKRLKRILANGNIGVDVVDPAI